MDFSTKTSNCVESCRSHIPSKELCPYMELSVLYRQTDRGKSATNTPQNSAGDEQSLDQFLPA